MAKVGIIGLGLVGNSALRFFQKDPNVEVSVWDQKISSISLDHFLQQNDLVLASPGVDLRPYQQYKEKFVGELDLFRSHFSKKTIGITGTIGKTTTTRLLGALLPYKNKIGGNIGIPMLDLLDNQDEVEWAVLELSSFQLEQNKTFAPDIAILTNVYQNHLDRHSTMKDYFEAKWNLFAHQNEKQQALFPLDLFGQKDLFADLLKTYRGSYSFVYDKVPGKELLSLGFVQNKRIFFIEQNIFCKALIRNSELVEQQKLHNLSVLPNKSFLQNWLNVFSVFDLLGIREFPKISLEKESFDKHRLELFTTISGADFYNDSKATVQEATRAAVEKLCDNGRPVVLVVGGLGKGVDRTPLVRFLAEKKLVKKIFCLGQGCPEFVEYDRYSSLETLVHAIMQTVSPGDQVLFSPSGTSFDLFSNYMERGEAFEKTVRDYKGAPSQKVSP